MTINIGQAMVKLAADTRQLGSDLDKAKGETTGWASGVGGIMKTAIGGAALAGAGIAIGAVAGIGKAAWDMAGDTREASANLRAEFGLTAEEAEAKSKLARELWTDNWGESITDTADALGVVQQQLSELGVVSDAELKQMTANAIGLRDVYGTEVSESVDATKTLMAEFGLTGQEAMDFIAAGMQKGLNRTGDFLDSITEYSTQFSNAGADAEDFFNIMDSGLAGGMLGTDKAADTFKEFRVRIQDGSATTHDALEQLGFDVDEFSAALANGDMTATEAFESVISKLGEVDDKNVQMQAGVALLGTQFEDMGTEAALALTTTGTSLDDMEGATDSLGNKYDSFGAVFEGFKRKALSALAPISDAMLDAADFILPKLETAFEKVSEIVTPIFETAAEMAKEFFTSLENGASPIEALMEALDNILPEDLITKMWDFIDWLKGIWEDVQPVVEQIIEAVSGFVSWKDILIVVGGVIAAAVLPMIGSLITTLAPVIAIVAAVIAVVALLRNAWENDWGGIRTKLTEVWEGTIRPALEKVWEWLKVKVPEALEAMRVFWVEVAWPAIQEAIETVWPIIENIFNAIKDFVTEKLIPTIQDLYQKWTEEWWPTIQTVLENVWTVIEEIFEEIGRWINDNIVPWIEFLSQKWSEEVWPAIQTALQKAWEFIEPIWEAIREWLGETIPPILEKFKGFFETAFEGIKAAIQPVKDLWDAFKSAVQSFWDWISGRVFSFKISLPDLPDWAVPGSPLPIHTAWADFAEDMANMGPINLPVTMGGEGQSSSTINNYYLTANYRYQSEVDLADDVRLMSMLQGT